MAKTSLLKPNHKAIRQYHEALQSYRDQHVKHEGALETAFSRLLADTARLHGWTLIPKQKLKIGKQNIFPDGTLRDIFTRRGFWKAKDLQDDLDAEIQKKISKGYPLVNTIFEDTNRAVQSRRRGTQLEEKPSRVLNSSVWIHRLPRVAFSSSVESASACRTDAGKTEFLQTYAATRNLPKRMSDEDLICGRDGSYLLWTEGRNAFG
jgi:hypothetical protein